MENLKKSMKFLRKILEEIQVNAGYYCVCENFPLWIARLLATRDMVYWLVGAFLCSQFGHNWQDDSVAGPDHGTMAASCDRCGHSFSTTLY